MPNLNTSRYLPTLIFIGYPSILNLIYNYNSVSVRPTTVSRLNGPVEPSGQSDSSAF